MSDPFSQFDDSDSDKPTTPAGETLRPVVNSAPAAGGDARALLFKRARAYAAKVPGVGEGGRNAECFKLAANLKDIVEDGEGLDFAGVFGLVSEWNSARNAPPLPEDELRAVVERVFKHAKGDALKESRPRPAGMRKPRPAPKPAGTVATGNDAPPLADDRDAAALGDDAGAGDNHIGDATEMVTADVVGDLSAHGDDAAPGLEWRPVPLECLPESLARFIYESAEAIGCDPGFVFLPALATLAGAVAGGASIAVKRGWVEPLNLWAGVVGVSGTSKTPALSACVEPLRAKHRQATVAWQVEMERHEVAEMVHKKQLAEWKSHAGDPPAKPKRPEMTYYVLGDTTVEKVALVLKHNPGVILVADELAAWLGGFGRYSGAAAGEVGFWLSLGSGTPTQVDRVGRDPLFVERGIINLAGGVQPQTLRRLVAGPLVESGLLARMLLAMPPESPAVWTDAEVSDATGEYWRCVVNNLTTLRASEPVKLWIDGDALALWKSETNAFGLLRDGLSESERALWSKLKGTAARIAGLLHCYRWAESKGELGAISVVDAEAGWELARWFLHEGRRVYSLCGLTGAKVPGESGDRDAKLLAWIARKGGAVTPRDVMGHNRDWYPDAEQAKRALIRLAAQGRLEYHAEPAAGPGRPTEYYTLKAVARVA